MTGSDSPARLGWKEVTLLSLFCLVLFSFPLFNNRVFCIHETVHCQNVREMLADGDWIIPHYGGRVWMERPPLPFWITAGFVKVLGDHPSAYRLAALVMGWWCVLLVAWMASVWYGRGVGLASGLILATMREFTRYSTQPEADIFLCAVVTSAMTLFVYLEYARQPTEKESTRFWAWRSWPVLAYFLVLGLTNLAKGLFFGTIWATLPVVAFLVWNLDGRALGRYVWLWGWLAFAAVGSAWAIAAYVQYPGVLDFWRHDYFGRVQPGYMTEPFWYYFREWPWVVFPWTPLALLGLWTTRPAAFQIKGSPERLLWCWAVLPILFFSIPHGKHHHYLLQGLAPWAIVAAVGAFRFWAWMARSPDWLRQPWLGTLLLGLPPAIALVVFRDKLPGPEWLAWVLALAWLGCATLIWWAIGQPHFLRGLGVVCVTVMGCSWTGYAYETAFVDNYQEDTRFLRASAAVVPPGQPLLVMDDDAPLAASWLLFNLDGRAQLLHNLTFLRETAVHDREIFLIVKQKHEPVLARYGAYVRIIQSERTRKENTPADRYALYRVHFHEQPERRSTPVRINPLQATGRMPGPFLD